MTTIGTRVQIGSAPRQAHDLGQPRHRSEMVGAMMVRAIRSEIVSEIVSEMIVPEIILFSREVRGFEGVPIAFSGGAVPGEYAAACWSASGKKSPQEIVQFNGVDRRGHSLDSLPATPVEPWADGRWIRPVDACTEKWRGTPSAGAASSGDLRRSMTQQRRLQRHIRSTSNRNLVGMSPAGPSRLDQTSTVSPNPFD